MHWLVRKSIESFLRDTYNERLCRTACHVPGAGSQQDFILDRHSRDLIDDAARFLDKTESDLLEDLGAWIARQERTRRLLRFSGRNFREFLLNLELLPDRMRMIVPDLPMPQMRVVEDGGDCLRVEIPSDRSEWLHAIAGLIRCMADDYGVLGLIWTDDDRVIVQISDGAFTSGRSFWPGEDDGLAEVESA